MRLGLDIGSTTIKCVLLDESNQMIYSTYERHFSHISEKTHELLTKINNEYIHNQPVILTISGSAGMGLAQSCGITFVQEVYAERVTASKLYPDTDCIIELGGEDAKILFLTNGSEVRMNGTCAGGTGAFIDQMATLLKLSASEMDELALQADKKYSIASRCGVFAKSDIQPLINQGAKTSNIAASIYQAVANQTIAGLAQGRKIEGNVLYLGGPLTFSKCLKQTFDETLKIQGICPEMSLLYVALGAAYYGTQEYDMKSVIEKMDAYDKTSTYVSLPALFNNRDEYWEFHNRHAKAKVNRIPFDESIEEVHIGIDSGSTTIKIVVIDDDANLLFTDYQSNNGNPITIALETFKKLYHEHPNLHIKSVTTTGYGEKLMQAAFHCDFGLVETVAHFTAAKYFMPNVDFIIDIGGQDMKCFKIEDGAISDIFLNEACSSGCGSFLQTFAQSLGYDVQEFAKMALQAQRPVDLGSRCTVFMNSSVKQAQKDGASIENISAGLAISVVKNALYKVIRCLDASTLGKHIVVQGGTFYNEAVLRAFEKELNVDVIRPDIAGLMGAYGAALYGLRHQDKETSTFLSPKEIENFFQTVTNVQCQGCGNHCQLTINTFQDGKRLISGNRCEKPTTGKKSNDELNLYAYKREVLSNLMQEHTGTRGKIGIPMVLNMFELLPFWHAFFQALDIDVIISPFSTHKMYQDGQGTIPSDTACYPAKLTHGHIHYLLQQEIEAIWYPCMSYNVDEHLSSNHYNCPIVAYYPESLKDNMEELRQVKFMNPFIDLSNSKVLKKKLPAIIQELYPSISKKEIGKAIDEGYQAYQVYKLNIKQKATQIIQQARKENKHIIVLAGRPYHIDPEVNHGIDQLVTSQNCAVISEDALNDEVNELHTNVLNQWTFHSRMYASAKYVTTQPDMDLIQLVSFGCGLDAITTDEIKEILQNGHKLYTELKIDEIVNLGAVNIRIRSLLAAIHEKEEKNGIHHT